MWGHLTHLQGIEISIPSAFFKKKKKQGFDGI